MTHPAKLFVALLSLSAVLVAGLGLATQPSSAQIDSSEAAPMVAGIEREGDIPLPLA